MAKRETIFYWIQTIIRSEEGVPTYVLTFMSESGRKLLSHACDDMNEVGQNDFAAMFKEDFDELYPEGWHVRWIGNPKKSKLLLKAVRKYHGSDEFKALPETRAQLGSWEIAVPEEVDTQPGVVVES